MKITEIREMGDAELEVKANDLSEELFRLRFQHGIRQLENTAKLSGIRKDIARIRTVLTEKKLNS